MLHLGARLGCALNMIGYARVAADIGCDHGRFACALAQRGTAERVIAGDISEAPLQRARALVARTGLESRVELRLGNGLTVLTPGEADAICLLGVGGTLMVRLLEDAAAPFQGAARALFQPMRAAEDIRRWAFEHGCHILDDRIVTERGRFYQLFMAAPPSPTRDTLPEGWPEDYFKLGYRAFQRREPFFGALAERRLLQTEARLKGGYAEALEREAGQLRRIIGLWEAEI